ncbi:hypothetical protein ACOMCU_24960 [Lysinibacillus sp. UGB7]|uniref:hypothetical protein n=1 Tax=Lysinibacillus sp. UGB7 TaxID=3411039 RepID=UPI003B807567
MSEKKRLTLTGNKMPDDVYAKLEQLGSERKLTPYICSLIEKEEKMDSLIDNLSLVIDKINNVENIVVGLNNKLENTAIQPFTTSLPRPNLAEDIEVIPEGKLEISSRIVGGIEEEIVESDF